MASGVASDLVTITSYREQFTPVEMARARHPVAVCDGKEGPFHVPDVEDWQTVLELGLVAIIEGDRDGTCLVPLEIGDLVGSTCRER